VDTNQTQSVFNFGTGSFSIVGWKSDVAIKNIQVKYTTGGSLYGGALAVVSPTDGGDVLLQNVTAIMSGGHAVVGEANERAGVKVYTKGNATVKNSAFQRSKSDGLIVASKSNVTLEGVLALENEGIGVWVDNCLYDLGDGACLTQGSVTLSGTNGFGIKEPTKGPSWINKGNTETGLYIQTGGKVSADANTVIKAQGNGWNGVEIERYNSDTSEAIELLGTNNFNYNINNGLQIYANGPITLHSITANNNSEYGTYIRGLFELDVDMDYWEYAAAGLGGTLTITGINEFNDNGNSGLEAYINGKITAANLNANGNGYFGALLSTCAGYEDEDYGFICYNDVDHDPAGTHEFYKEGVDYDVTITGDNVFGSTIDGEGWGNEYSGLQVITYGDIRLGTSSTDSVTVQNNYGEYGAKLQAGVFQSYDEHGEWYLEDETMIGGGNITLAGTHLYGGYNEDLDVSYGNNGDGLVVRALSTTAGAGQVSIENDVDAISNDEAGVYVNSSNGAKIANVTSKWNADYGIRIQRANGDVEVSDSEFSENDGEGLAAWYFEDTALSLKNVKANDNVSMGIWVGDGVGEVTIDQCEANGNYSEGMYFDEISKLTITNSEASENGVDEDIVGIYANVYHANLENVTANGNGNDGMYFVAGNVIIKQSTASENNGDGISIDAFGYVTIKDTIKVNDNGNSGLYISSAGTKAVTIDGVEASGNDGSGIEIFQGAIDQMKNFTPLGAPTGKISVTNVEAMENEDDGIAISANGDVLVKNVEASGNMNGLTIFGDDTGVPGDYTVSCSTFNSNSNMGVHIAIANNVNLWGVNASDNGEVDIVTEAILGSVFESDSCTGGACVCEPKEPGLPGVVVPVVGGENVTLECGRAWTMLQMGNLDAAKFSGLCGGELSATLSGLAADGLPSALPEGMLMGSGMTTGMNGASILPNGGTVRVSFVVPEALQGKTLSILYWDAAAGAWVKLPLFGEGGFAGSDAAMQVLSGVQVNADGTVSVTVNFGGTFVLVGE